MKKNRLLTIISALAVLAGGVGAAHAQNLVANGDFTANAAAFTDIPGYLGDGTGANPTNITSWLTYPNDLGKGINGLAAGVGNIFGPTAAAGYTFAFIQNGGNGIYQLLPLATSTTYTLNIDIAGRGGDASPALFSVKMADGLPAFWDSNALNGGNPIPTSQGGFTHYAVNFTTPATMTTGFMIQLWNESPSGDFSVNYANVSIKLATTTNLNIIGNGDFTANAAGYTVWPGYNQDGLSGHNPAGITDWVNASGAGKGVNGAAVSFAGSPFGPTTTGGRTYALLQGAGTLTQYLPITYAPGKAYQLNFDAAARAGEFSIPFQVQIGDASQTHFTTQVEGVDLIGNNAAFVPYVYIFNAPATFDGTPSINLYNLVASGGTTIDFANVSLQVATHAVLISQQPTPAALSLYAGGTATFTALAIGTNTVSYRWRHAGTNLSDGPKFSGTTTPTLVINNLTTAEAGSYDVVASVGPNSVTSQAATLSVSIMIITQPLTPTAVELYVGRTASFTFVAEGIGTTSYKWRKNGSNLSDAGKYSGTGTTNLVITNVSSGEVGFYDVVATVTAGSLTSSVATLAVVPVPVPGTYPAAVLSLNPMGYWRFSDGGGTNGFDYIAGNTAVDPLGSPLQAGPRPPDFGGFESLNTAPHMNGTNQGYASTSQMFNGLSEFTLMGWFNIDPNQYPFTHNADGRASLFGQQWTAELSFYQGTNLYFYAQGIAPPGTIFITSGFDPGVWHFLVAVNDASATTIYLDGVVAGVGGPCPGVVLPYHFSIGDYVSNFPNVPSPFPGSIDEVAAFDHAISASDVENLYKVATPVMLKIGWSGANQLKLTWPQGTLLQADTITGLWTTNNASSPYLFAPSAAKRFYRVKVQ